MPPPPKEPNQNILRKQETNLWSDAHTLIASESLCAVDGCSLCHGYRRLQDKRLTQRKLDRNQVGVDTRKQRLHLSAWKGKQTC